jgi:hypothetical protein
MPLPELDLDGAPRPATTDPATGSDGPGTFALDEVEGAHPLELDDGTGPTSGGLEAITPPHRLEAIPPGAPVPQGVEPGAIGHYDPRTSAADYDPHPFALESNPPGAPGASQAGGKMPSGVRQEAGVFAEHGTSTQIMEATVPGYERNGPQGQPREGYDTRHQPTISAEASTKTFKDNADAAAFSDIQARQAAGEEVPWIEGLVGGNERLRDAAAAGGSQAPGYQHTKDFLAEIDYVQTPRHGFEEVRPGEPFPGPNPFADADVDAHVDTIFAPFVDEPAPAGHGTVALPADAGPVPALDLSGSPGTGSLPEHGLVDLPEGTGPPPPLDLPDAHPRLLGEDTRSDDPGMESGGSELHAGAPASRTADAADRVGLGARTSAAKTLASAFGTATGPESPAGSAGAVSPGSATAYGAVLGNGGGMSEGDDLGALRAEAAANVEPVDPHYPEPPGSDADLAKMEDDIEAILADRAQAEADAAEMEASAAVAEENQTTAEGVEGRVSSVAGPAAQAHAAAVARREQRNQEQQQQLQESQQQTTTAAEEVGGTATLVTLLGVWSGFTGLLSYLPGSAGAAFEELNGEANTFLEKLAEAKGLIESEDAAGPTRQAESEGNEARLQQVEAENEATRSTIDTAGGDAAVVGEQQGQLASEAHDTAARYEGEADDAQSLAEDITAEHDTLAEELQAWAEEHRAARAAAVEETVLRLEAEGYTVTQVCDW